MRVRSRAGADDALLRGSRALFVQATHRWNTHMHSVCIPNACMQPYPCAAGYTAERIADARRTRARAASKRARVRLRLGAHASGADTCERVPSAWTLRGSARRRSTMRRRSTRTSARGTPRRSKRCSGYAPPFRPGRGATAGGTRRVFDAARAVVRGGTADARAGVRGTVWARACAGVPVCKYSCA
jgi:hypothetical protein